MKFESFTIRQLLDSVSNGAIRIPAFQRGFVWDMERVAYLMDSIFKNYPFGSLLFWRTKNQLKIERKLGPFLLSDPKDEYPIDYVLDGQQRLTSIFAVFQSDLTHDDADLSWSSIYYDLSADADAQDSQFISLSSDKVNAAIHFPLNVLFDSVKYRKATEVFSGDEIRRLDKLQERFKEISIPVQVLNTEDRSIVAIVFERVNRLGVELDTLQLLSAWTWNEDFDLLEKFKELKEELEEFGFAGVGENSDLMLRCAAAILQGDPVVSKLLDLNGSQIRDEFATIRNGILGAIDFLKKQFKVSSLKNLPSTAMIVPLSVFFSKPDGKDIVYSSDTTNKLKQWFWRSCFTKRYSSQIRRTTANDIIEIKKAKEGKQNNLGNITCNVEPSFFLDNVFGLATANTKTFILLLCQKSPLTFISKTEVDLNQVLQKYNRTEFHHIYPRAYLKKEGIAQESMNCLANFCFLNAAENRKISNKTPSDYVSLLPEGDAIKEIKDRALLPDCTFNDDYEAFRTQRATLLASYATELLS